MKKINYIYLYSSLAALGKAYDQIKSILKHDAFLADKKDRKELLNHVYHASLPAEDRKWVLNEYSSSSSIIRCLICSSAFGMCINIPDNQHVVLWGGTFNHV